MKHKKIIIISIILLAVTFILIALFNSTYALFSTDDYADGTNNFTTGMLDIQAVSKSENISLSNALPMKDEDGLNTTPYEFTIKNVGNLDYKFDVKLLSTGTADNTFSSQYIRLQIDDGEVVSLSDLSNGVIKDDLTLLVGESVDISIRIWLSIDTPNTQLGKSFNSWIVTDGQAIYTSGNNSYGEKVNFINYLTSLYTNNIDDTPVTHGGINYNYASSVRLMNDRLGSSEVDANGGNIRFYGADDGTLNNYVYFNCSDYTKQSKHTCEVWRIIGIVDGKIKIVRNESLGNFSWDYDYNDGNGAETYSNDWRTSSINALLNGAYYNNVDTVYYSFDYEYDDFGAETEVIRQENLNFNSDEFGINDQTRNLISTSNIKINGKMSSDYLTNSNNYHASGVYRAENSSEDIWNGNIFLMYASDFGYANDFTNCTFFTCTSDDYNYNWLGKGKNYWLINPDGTSGHSLVSHISYFNRIHNLYLIGGDGVYYPYNSYGIYPTLYLDPDIYVNLGYGDGSSSRPYELYVNLNS